MNNWRAQWRAFVRESSYIHLLREKGISNDQFWREYDVYDEMLRYMGYPGRILSRISSLISPGAKLLDIGAGTGAFTIPLAKIAGRVIALDPSGYQLDVLRRKSEGLQNIYFIQDEWPKAEIDIAVDYALAAYSLFSEEIDAFLQRMIDVSRAGVFIVFRAEPSDPLNEFAYGPRQYVDYRCIHHILHEMGYCFDVDIFPRDYTLPLEYVLKQYRYSERSPQEIIDFLRDAGRLNEASGEVTASFSSSDALLYMLKF